MKPNFIKVTVMIEIMEEKGIWDGDKMGVGSFEATLPASTINSLDLNGVKNAMVQEAANNAIEKGLITVPVADLQSAE